MTLEHYLLDFGLPDEEYDMEYQFTEVMKLLTVHTTNKSACPICGGNHYMPLTVSAPTTWTNEQYRQQLEQICLTNRGAFWVSPYGRPEDCVTPNYSSTAVLP